MSDPEILTESGFLYFDSMAHLRRYIGDLLKHYDRKVDLYSEEIGKLLRDRERNIRNARKSGNLQRNWSKVGFMYVNSKDPAAGTLEALLELLEDYKARADRTMEILKDFDKLEDLDVPNGPQLILSVKSGIPFRIILGAAPGIKGSTEPIAIAP